MVDLSPLAYAASIVAIASETRLPLWIAAAMVEKESGGLNVYGNDRGGVYAVGDPERPEPNVVTAENYARFEQRVLDGATSNGVGPTQITWPGFIKDAKARGIRLWVPEENFRYGFTLLAGYLGGKTDDASIKTAGTRYNGASAYGDDLLRRAKLWRERLEGAMTEVSSLGWAPITTAGVKRVGPHTPTTGNPREITFRNNATGDLLSAAMWLAHTGLAGKYEPSFVYYWHGLRPKDAAFGTSNSDHDAGVAEDWNWLNHFWEPAIGTAAYDAHMKDERYVQEHQMFREIVRKLAVPGKTPVLRWGGEPWQTDSTAQPLGPNGSRIWTAYARGHRDCMHWVIGTRDWDRINAAAAHLRTWFRVPRSADDIRGLQKLVGATADGQWGPKSVSLMKTWERSIGRAGTGLPNMLAHSWKPPAPEPEPTPEVDPVVMAPTKIIGGPNRYEVAAAVSRERFPSGAPVAYLAVTQTDDVAVAASFGDGPVLLVKDDATFLPSATARELRRLRPTGGVKQIGSGISQAVLDQAAREAAR